MDCFASLAMTGPLGPLSHPRTIREYHQPSPLLHQRIARGGELLKFLRVAAGVRMRALGSALVGLVDFRPGQAAAERQAEHLPVTLRGRERLRIGLSLAELPGAKRVQDIADNAESPPRGISRDRLGAFGQGAAQDKQA